MRAKKAALNTITSLSYQLVAIVCGLITPRLILETYGSTYNGVISSATQFMSMISILTLGIAGATRVELYKTLSKDDVLGTSRIMKATGRYMRKVAICVLVYACILMLVYPFISHNDLPKYEVAMLIGIVSIGTFAEYFFGTAYRTLLMADQREYIYSALQIIATILNTIVAAILIFADRSIFIVKLASVCVFALSPIVMYIYVKRNYKITNECEADTEVLKQRKMVAYHSIANIIHDNTDLILLTLFTDAKVISVYTVYNFVAGKIKSLMRSFTGGLEAAFGNMWVKKEMQSIQKNFRIYEFATFSFVSIVFACVGVLIIPFVEQYTKGVHDINYIRYGFATLITVAEAVFCIRQPYLTLVQATGNYKATKNGAIMEACINFSCSLVLVNVIGLNGVIVGTLIANLIRTSQYVWFISRHILNRKISCVLYRCLWLVFNIAIIIASSKPIMNTVNITGWTGWMVQAAIVFLISCVETLIMAVIFYKNDLVHMFLIFKRVIKR